MALGQYSITGKPVYEAFIAKTANRKGSTSIDAQIDQVMEDYDDAYARATRGLSRARTISDAFIRDLHVQRATDILSQYPPIERRLLGFEGMSRSSIESALKDFDALWVQTNTFNRSVETVEKKEGILQSSAEDLAQAARNEITSGEMEQIRAAAGGDDQYFANLYQQAFMSNLVEKYGEELDPYILTPIKQQITKTKTYIEAAGPESPSINAILYAADMAKDAIARLPKPSMFGGIAGNTLKWAAMLGGGVLLGGFVLTSAAVRGLKSSKRKK